MANNKFLDSLGISNITTSGEGNYYNSYSFTLYYRIRRSQILWEYTNPDIKAIVYFSDGSSYSPGWKTKQGDSGNYKYEGDDGVGNYTISLPSSSFKTITSIELQTRKSSSTSGKVDFNKIFSFEAGKKFYSSIYFEGKEVREVGDFTLSVRYIEPQKQIMTTSTLPEIIGESSRGISSSKLFFGDKIKIFRPSTFTYLGKSNLSPTKIQLSARNVGSGNFLSMVELITPNKNTTIDINSYFSELNKEEIKLSKDKQIEFQAIFYVGENGTYTYTTIMYWVEALDLYLDTSNLSIRPNKIVKENMDNDVLPFDIRTNVSGTIKIKEELKENSFPFSIKAIQCEISKEEVLNRYTIFEQSTSNFVNLDFTSTETGSIIEPTNITLIFKVVPFLSSDTEKDYIYTYSVSQMAPEDRIISLRGIQYSISNVYVNDESFKDGKPIILEGETISFSCSTTKTIYNPNNRDWEMDEDINSKMEFYIDGFKLEGGQYNQNRNITQTVEKILIPKYANTKDKILIENVYSGQASIRLGRTQKIEFINAYIQDQQLNYILSDNGGDQSSEISSTQYLENESSLFRGKSQTLTITFYSNDDNQVSGTVEIASLDDAKKCFKENNKNTLSLSEIIFSEINLEDINLEDVTEISFTYNKIESERIEITIKGRNPTLSLRKNGLIINGQPNQQLEGTDFIEINALSTDKTISIKYLGDDGKTTKGQIAFENGKIVLKNIYIPSSCIIDS